MSKVLKTSSTSIEIVPSMNKLNIIEDKSLNCDGREDLQDGFLLCDLGAVLSNYQRWVKAFPRITPFYAVKCNPDTTMLKTLIALGAGFDCASKKEIRQLIELGAQPDKIIYANPSKQTSHVRYSRDNDVKLVVVDSEEELIKMKKNFPEAQLVLRIRTEDSQSLYPLSSKFGATMELSYHLIDTAHAMGLNMSGISFHVGCQCSQAKNFLHALQNCKTLFDYAETVGYKFNLLDIGGGYYGSEDTRMTFEKFASNVSEHVDELFPKDKFKHVRIIAEPGRYMAESVFTLATSVIAKKKAAQNVSEKDTKSNGPFNHDFSTSFEGPAFMYYISDGMYGALYNVRYETVTPHPLKPVPEKAIKFPSTIWGPTCDNLDCVMKDVVLPELTTSDWLVWHNMGAYNMTLSCFYNGFNTSIVYYVISEHDCDLLHSVTGGKNIPDVEFVRK